MPEARESPLARSIWSGSISFGLVTVPVDLYSAWRRHPGVSLRMLGPSGTPLQRQYVCPRDGEVVTGDQIERGYELPGGEFVVVTEQELERVAPGRSRDIALERFVPRDAIDPAYLVRSYVLMPGGEQVKAYALLAETMESSGRAGIARFVMRGKSYAVAIYADRGVLRAEVLRFGDEVRGSAELGLPAPKPVPASVLEEVAARVEHLAAARLDERELVDPQVGRLLELARRKRKRGEGVVEVAAGAPGEPASGTEAGNGGDKVVDLMAVLKQRMKQREEKPAHRRAATDTRPKTRGVR